MHALYLAGSAQSTMSRWGLGRGIRFQPASGSSSSSGGAAIPPPPSIQANVIKPKGFASLTAINQNANVAPTVDPYAAAVKRRNKTEEQYFDEEDDEPLAYIPAPGSPSYKGPPKADSDDDDPLDAFMAGIEQQVKKQAEASKVEVEKVELKGIRDDIEGEDDEETYYRYVAENPNFGKDEESDNEDLEYDQDGNPIAPKKSKYIDPLPPLDHSTINYEPFEKNFYNEHTDIEQLSSEKVDELRDTLGIKVFVLQTLN